MRTIKAQPLSQKAFARYGSYQNLLDTGALTQRSVTGGEGGFYADVLPLAFSGTTQPTVSVCHVTRQPRNIVSFIEAHQYTCEGLLPLDGDVVIFVGALAWGDIDPSALEAFIVPKSTFVRLDPLVLHGTQFALEGEEAHLLCMLPMRTFRNDLLAKTLEGEERVEIVL